MAPKQNMDSQLSGSTKIDPVLGKLRELSQGASGKSETVALRWLEAQELRRTLLSQTKRCLVASWLILFGFASASAIVATLLHQQIKTTFEFSDSYFAVEIVSDKAWIVISVLWLIAFAILILGLIGLASNRFPGLRSTRAAVDWASTSDAIARLLSSGCSYPDAFQLARESLSTTRFGDQPAAYWLLLARKNAEQGRPFVSENSLARGDAALLDLLIDPIAQQPDIQWAEAARQYDKIAIGRRDLIVNGVPPLTTVLSGILLWVSVSSSMSWVWRSMQEMIGGLT